MTNAPIRKMEAVSRRRNFERAAVRWFPNGQTFPRDVTGGRSNSDWRGMLATLERWAPHFLPEPFDVVFEGHVAGVNESASSMIFIHSTGDLPKARPVEFTFSSNNNNYRSSVAKRSSSEASASCQLGGEIPKTCRKRARSRREFDGLLARVGYWADPIG